MGYSELRPAYTGEPVSVTITVDGVGSIAAWSFTAAVWNPDGTSATGTPAAVVLDGTARTVLLTLPGQATPGEYAWECRRTDSGNNLVVAHGRIDVYLSGGRS